MSMIDLTAATLSELVHSLRSTLANGLEKRRLPRVGMRLRAGDFYMNPKDNPHGPTIAHEKSLLIEIYDGPHYYEKPVFHTDETIGDFIAKKS